VRVRLATVAACCWLLWCLAAASQNIVGGGVYGDVKVSSGGGCSQATNFLARTSGLSGTATTNYTNLLCALQTAGIGCNTSQTTNLDALYILGAPDATTEKLNLCSSSFTLTTPSTPPTFTANSGATFSSGIFYDTGYTPSSSAGALTQNSASIFVYDLTNSASGSGWPIGASTNTFSIVLGMDPLNNTYINEATGTSTGSANRDGGYVIVRNAASAGFIRRNESALTAITTTSNGLPNNTIFFGCLDQGGNTACTTDTVFAEGFGPALTTTQADALMHAINTFAKALSINVY
jgi:hypothetical protein